ncbi:MAG TPA: hypothetical protein VFU04_02885 [Solirubrobacterales bacterium]|nr:hypothetical protein [Solirubrobacterales bacterium]
MERALAYPYDIPTGSYALVAGKAVQLTSANDVDCDDRIALLAYGSNASPNVLARKLSTRPDPVPVVRTVLRDFDVVYSAHLSLYGAVPATLTRSSGTEATAFIAYLTERQLALVSATEPNYHLARFDRPSCTLDRGVAPAELQVYLSRHGPLRLDGGEVALAAIEARERRLPAMGQREVLERVRDLVCPGSDLATLIREHAGSRIDLSGEKS